MLSIRLRRAGSSKKPYFRVVVTEARSGRDSSFVENVGTYNPRSKPADVALNKARLEHWLKRGAKPSDTVRTLLSKHMSRDLSAMPETAAPQ
jgi:small subunit ribosomal protein S16